MHCLSSVIIAQRRERITRILRCDINGMNRSLQKDDGICDFYLWPDVALAMRV